MSDEIGPIPQAGKVVFYNPDAPDEVRKVTAPAAWQDITAATFGQCAVALEQKGTTGQYFADLPAGLSASREYTFALYGSDANSFDDPSDVMGYSPNVTPTSETTTEGETVGTTKRLTIQYPPHNAPHGLYFVIQRVSDGHMWNGTTFEEYDADNWTT